MPTVRISELDFWYCCTDRLVECRVARRDLGATWVNIDNVNLPVGLVAKESDTVQRVDRAPRVLIGISDEGVYCARPAVF